MLFDLLKGKKQKNTNSITTSNSKQASKQESKGSGFEIREIQPRYNFNNYTTLTPVEIDLEGIVQKKYADVEAQTIGETKEYWVYKITLYKELWIIDGRTMGYQNGESYLLRVNKKGADIVYLDEAFNVGYVLFNNRLFYILSGHWGSSSLFSIHIETGKHTYYDKWFSERTVIIGDVGRDQDVVDAICIEDDCLRIKVKRDGSHQKADPFDINTTYFVYANLKNEKFHLSYRFTEINADLLKTVVTGKSGKWSVESFHDQYDTYYLKNREGEFAESDKGFILQTSYLSVAEGMLKDLESDKTSTCSVLGMQKSIHETISLFSKEQATTFVKSGFNTIDDWTFFLEEKDQQMEGLLGKRDQRIKEIDSWLNKATHMQLNAAYCIGTKYRSLNIAYIFALILERTEKAKQELMIGRLNVLISKQTECHIDKEDFRAFSVCYGVHVSDNNLITNDVWMK